MDDISGMHKEEDLENSQDIDSERSDGWGRRQVTYFMSLCEWMTKVVW